MQFIAFASSFGLIATVLAATDSNLPCLDWEGNTVEHGSQYIPNRDDLCNVCTCDRGFQVACHNVLCSPPNCRLYEKVEGECCKFNCIHAPNEGAEGDGNYTVGEPKLPEEGLKNADATNMSIRLVASTVTSFLILALLLFMVHRLRQRRTLIMLRRLNSERIEDDDSAAYMPQIDQVDIGLEYPPYEDPPPPYSPPKPQYFPQGDAPPPYEEHTPRAAILANNNNNAYHNNSLDPDDSGGGGGGGPATENAGTSSQRNSVTTFPRLAVSTEIPEEADSTAAATTSEASRQARNSTNHDLLPGSQPTVLLRLSSSSPRSSTCTDVSGNVGEASRGFGGAAGGRDRSEADNPLGAKARHPSVQYIKKSDSIEIRRGSNSPRNSFCQPPPESCDGDDPLGSVLRCIDRFDVDSAAPGAEEHDNVASRREPVGLCIDSNGGMLARRDVYSNSSMPMPSTSKSSAVDYGLLRNSIVSSSGDVPGCRSDIKGKKSINYNKPPTDLQLCDGKLVMVQRATTENTLPVSDIAGVSEACAAASRGRRGTTRPGGQCLSRARSPEDPVERSIAQNLQAVSSPSSYSARAMSIGAMAPSPASLSPVSPMGNNPFGRSASISSQTSVFSVCSETGEKKRPRTTNLPLSLRNDVPYPLAPLSSLYSSPVAMPLELPTEADAALRPRPRHSSPRCVRRSEGRLKTASDNTVRATESPGHIPSGSKSCEGKTTLQQSVPSGADYRNEASSVARNSATKDSASTPSPRSIPKIIYRDPEELSEELKPNGHAPKKKNGNRVKEMPLTAEDKPSLSSKDRSLPKSAAHEVDNAVASGSSGALEGAPVCNGAAQDDVKTRNLKLKKRRPNSNPGIANFGDCPKDAEAAPLENGSEHLRSQRNSLAGDATTLKQYGFIDQPSTTNPANIYPPAGDHVPSASTLEKMRSRSRSRERVKMVEGSHDQNGDPSSEPRVDSHQGSRSRSHSRSKSVERSTQKQVPCQEDAALLFHGNQPTDDNSAPKPEDVCNGVGPRSPAHARTRNARSPKLGRHKRNSPHQSVEAQTPATGKTTGVHNAPCNDHFVNNNVNGMLCNGYKNHAARQSRTRSLEICDNGTVLAGNAPVKNSIDEKNKRNQRSRWSFLDR